MTEPHRDNGRRAAVTHAAGRAARPLLLTIIAAIAAARTFVSRVELLARQPIWSCACAI
jgi:hypothetical protein